MTNAIEQAKAYGVKPIAIHAGPFGIPIVESADVPKGTLMILQPFQGDRYNLDVTSAWDEESQQTVFIATVTPKRK